MVTAARHARIVRAGDRVDIARQWAWTAVGVLAAAALIVVGLAAGGLFLLALLEGAWSP